ncbi:TPA: hypothetical protein N8237_005464 [Escherichia coli]|nr:hypothetical protein [Escherichia coli]EIH0402275.1 hypothetical protein [Escherichia coli]HAI1532312.1 hypothetical protein [Escherichia coli]HAM9650635.1 hypothetical protein [Escherichia coli]HCO4615756.1 hypothetical protein [Escherichia coli]
MIFVTDSITIDTDTGKNGRKLPFRAASYFRIPFIINTYKPEDQFFVSGIHLQQANVCMIVAC